MIKNAVFDIGGVLLEYEPERFIRCFGFDEADIKPLLKTIFKSDVWLELDKGTLSFKEAEDITAGRAPEYEKQIRTVYSDSERDALFGEKGGTVAFMRELKRDGYMIYLLSNFSREGYKHIEAKYGFIKEAHGGVISSAVGMIKPEPGIYKALIDKYGLIPGETVFIDDVQANVAAANGFGINGILFTDIEEVKHKFYLLTEGV